MGEGPTILLKYKTSKGVRKKNTKMKTPKSLALVITAINILILSVWKNKTYYKLNE